eukprot:SAG22_NODE_30_length_28348_cov_12.488584_17_plen_224_part_00
MIPPHSSPIAVRRRAPSGVGQNGCCAYVWKGTDRHCAGPLPVVVRRNLLLHLFLRNLLGCRLLLRPNCSAAPSRGGQSGPSRQRARAWGGGGAGPRQAEAGRPAAPDAAGGRAGAGRRAKRWAGLRPGSVGCARRGPIVVVVIVPAGHGGRGSARNSSPPPPPPPPPPAPPPAPPPPPPPGSPAPAAASARRRPTACHHPAMNRTVLEYISVHIGYQIRLLGS